MSQSMENTNQSGLICENPAYRKYIISEAAARNKSKIFHDFIEQLYAYLPVDYMLPNRIEYFVEIALLLFEFSSNRKPVECKLAYINSHNELFDGTVLQIVMTDSDYIVDSIKALLQKRGLNIELMLHPAMTIFRDNNGAIQAINDSRGVDEFLVFLIIQGLNSEADKQELLADLTGILAKLESINQSQLAISAKLAEIKALPQQEAEAALFLAWLAQDNFTFLNYSFCNKNGVIENNIGDTTIHNNSSAVLMNIIENACPTSLHNLKLGKINQLSEIVYKHFIDYIVINDNEGQHIFFGLYSHNIARQSVAEIPLLRNKLAYVTNRSAFAKDGYNYHKLASVVQSFPREVLFQINDEDLYCIALHILSAMLSKSLKLYIQADKSAEFLNVFIFMPRERLTPDAHLIMTKYLITKFNTSVIMDDMIDVGNGFGCLYITLRANGTLPEFSLIDIEQELDYISAKWHQAFLRSLRQKYENTATQFGIIPENFFPKEYQLKFAPREAVEDYEYLHKLAEKSVLFNLRKRSATEYSINIYSSTNIALSDILPLIENLGFKALSQDVFTIQMPGGCHWIYEFALIQTTTKDIDFKTAKSNVEEALDQIIAGQLESNYLCRLIMLAGLNCRQVTILNALTSYLAQTKFVYGKEYVQHVLVKHYEFAELLLELFEQRFNPKKQPSTTIIAEIFSALSFFLNNISSGAEDKTLRTITDIIQAINRTNCYQLTNGKIKSYLSFKFDSSKVPCLPKPLPFAEIFVYARNFEAIHLRGGKVARGGIRWSDRGEDYRVEVLGLMKAQLTKNTLIVPVGAKGAFYIKVSADSMPRTEYLQLAKECYQNFLRGLLDITDNMLDGKVVHPNDTIIYDEADPYLVVAADKGTATFSDYANAVSAEYNFWLSDAFASGGSSGYDHKVMGITAKGGWISVTNHFAEMGIDVQKDPITVVGIGDMSGDVFGNGMLLSEAIKLVAAFNHNHIFIDPEPNPVISYQERLRLFKLPSSGWNDYNFELISKGGGIFARSAKTIKLSDEIRRLLGVTYSEVTPDNLINDILKAKIDLLWNGGIGTYIKASDETQLEVGDKNNDNLRCNANQVRARVIGEGGNLGITQRGRIEFHNKGGRINTDFIDNSGGVDCSDHEVNIKIALNQAVKSQFFTLEERNVLLSQMTNQVEKLVLLDNYKQNLAISIAESSPLLTIDMFAHLMRDFEEKKILDRSGEYLPSDAELARLSQLKGNLSRPELAVLLSYTKMAVYDELIDSPIAETDFARKILIDYFPPMMQERFLPFIESHPLRNEIIVTVITNKIVNHLSGPVINNIKSETGAKLYDIVCAYIIVSEVFDIDHIWQEAEKLAKDINREIHIEIYSEIIKLMRRGISWFIRNLPYPIDITKAATFYSQPVQNLCGLLGKFLLGGAKEKFNNRIEHYKQNNVPEELVHKIAVLDSAISALDIIMVSYNTSVPDAKVAELYFQVADYFGLDWLRKACEKQANNSYWSRMSVQAMKDDFYDKQRRIMQHILTHSATNLNFALWLEENAKYTSILLKFIKELQAQEVFSLPEIILANKQFDVFLRKISGQRYL